MDVKNQASAILQNRYGFNSFRGLQEPTIDSLLAGQNTVLIMPTGGGKSLCYQIPAEILPGLTLVVSPLIALIQDQVAALRRRGFEGTVALHAGLTAEKRQKALQSIRKGEARLAFVTPERFRKTNFLESIRGREISLFVVDEAHCMSQWGHDFRPEYSRLGEVRKSLGEPLTLALTATAPPEVRADIVRLLGLTEPRMLVAPVERPNLYLGVLDTYGEAEKTQNFIGLRHRFPGPAIFYFSLISTLYRHADALRALGLELEVYHGDLPPKVRHAAQERFQASRDGLLLATPAFGLGVDKPDVRLIVHGELPGSIEAYFQEVGRAGRDGHPSHCFLLHDEEDVATQMDFLKWSNPDPGFYHALYRLIEKNPDRVRAEGLEFLKRQMNFYNSRDFRVETALGRMARYEIIEWPERNFRKLQVVADLLPELTDQDLFDLRMRGLQKKLLRFLNYTRLESCRKQDIYHYFGEADAKPCGFCDRCQPIL